MRILTRSRCMVTGCIFLIECVNFITHKSRQVQKRGRKKFRVIEKEVKQTDKGNISWLSRLKDSEWVVQQSEGERWRNFVAHIFENIFKNQLHNFIPFFILTRTRVFFLFKPNGSNFLGYFLNFFFRRRRIYYYCAKKNYIRMEQSMCP